MLHNSMIYIYIYIYIFKNSKHLCTTYLRISLPDKFHYLTKTHKKWGKSFSTGATCLHHRHASTPLQTLQSLKCSSPWTKIHFNILGRYSYTNQIPFVHIGPNDVSDKLFKAPFQEILKVLAWSPLLMNLLAAWPLTSSCSVTGSLLSWDESFITL